MVKNPKCLTPIVCVRDVLAVLRDTTHHGFPVVLDGSKAAGEEGVGQLEGLVLRSQILVLLRERC
jgi:CBS domain-containing protein